LAVSSKSETESEGGGLPAGWETVIGLEVHVQLRTRTKLFSAAPNAFGAEPNTQTTEVDVGMPGVLPVLNRRAVELAVRTALALGCELQPVSIFARKHYFYPDLPKGYQISQYEEPFAVGGGVPIEHNGESRTVALVRIHMEEDAAKSIHDDSITGVGVSHVNLNRAGVPLIEIVSTPEIRTPEEAGAYLRSLRSELGTKVELKNLNSFRYVERAIAYESRRQVELIEDGGSVVQETRLWDDRAAETRSMRSKEYADDYRYFPDPDLVALRLEPEWLEEMRRNLPELPRERRQRFEQEHGLPAYDAQVLTDDRDVADFFEAGVRLYANPKTVSNWVMRDVLGTLKERAIGIRETKLTPEYLAELLRLVDEGRVTASVAREVLPEVAESGTSPAAVVQTRGLEAVRDTGELEAIAGEVIEANPKQVEQYRSGQEKLVNFFVGQVMKRTRGKADPNLVKEILARLLAG
jgi:aspartyl-tRNA(Asn)/glutamyl-tRNA(Gln) amidotransferase subunit B